MKKSTTKLYWYGAGSEVLLETNASGGSPDEYIFFGGRRVARRKSTGEINYYFADHLGSSRVVTSATGTILDDSDFYPFGGERVVTSTSGNDYKFTGHERDAETGLDYMKARYYSAAYGRFASPDPGGLSGWSNPLDPQGWNAYAYARNNPLLYTDPDGTVYQICVLNSAGKLECSFVSDKSFSKLKNDPGAGITIESSSARGRIFGTVDAFGTRQQVGFFMQLDADIDEDVSQELRVAGEWAEQEIRSGAETMAFNAAAAGLGRLALPGLRLGYWLSKLKHLEKPVATSPELQAVVNELFRRGSRVPGGTAGAVLYEKIMGRLLSRAGHMQKATERANQLDRMISAGNLPPRDLALARELLSDLRHALRVP